jgi:hypothetical protein
VVLVRVGDIYSVRDGDHRISVARAMGQQDVDAEVAIWQVAGLLPWETAAQAPSKVDRRRRSFAVIGCATLW